MGKIQVNQLEKADTLPFRCNRAYHLTTKYGSMWNLPKWDGYHKGEKHKYEWIIAQDIIENNIGKSFDLAFSYYCKKVHIRKQKYFLDEFNGSGWRYRYRPDYYIDENGLIQTNIKPIEKKEVTFTSTDYKTKLAHKDTKHWFDDFHEIWTKKEVTYTRKLIDGTFTIRTYKQNDKLLGLRYKGNGYWATYSDFERIVVQGTKITYSSKNDPRYIRYITESIKRQNLEYKRNKKIPKLSNEDFRKILKEKELKERQLNLIKIESHGFDPLTSFRKLKTN